MAKIRNFWDLENITSYSSHIVDQFDNNTPNSGGGFFKWINSNNTSITNIAGIRIKPTTTIDGYWLRDYDGPLKVNWFGVRNSSQTMSAAGITQGVANIRYGTNLVNVVTDTYDTAAIKFAFKLLEDFNYNSLEFSNGTYWIGSTLELPRFNGTGTPGDFTINGNSAIIRTTVGNSNTIFNRVPANQTTALSGGYIDSRFYIRDFVFIGTGAAGSGQTAIRLGPSFGSHIENIDFSCDIGMNLEFCLNARLENIMGIPGNYGIKIDFGEAWGGSSTNSQSNHTTLNNCRIYAISGNTIAGYYIRGSSGVVINSSIVEGTGANYGVFFDTNQSTVVKNFKVDGLHIETICSNAAIYLRCNGGQYVLDNIGTGLPQVLVEMDVPSGYPQVTIYNIDFAQGSQFANKNAGAIWKFVDCNLGPPPWQPAPGTEHPYRSTAWVIGGAYFQPTGRYSEVYASQQNYRCYVIDPVLRQTVND